MAQDPYTPVYGISVAAELAGMHPQTLRQYDRLGLVVPQRPSGGQRRYCLNDVTLLRKIQDLSRTGVSLEGIRRIVTLEREVTELRDTVGLLVGQLETIRANSTVARTFTAGSTGDVDTEFFPRPAQPGTKGEEPPDSEFNDEVPVQEYTPQSRAEAAQKQLERVMSHRQGGPRQLTSARRYAITWTGREVQFTPDSSTQERKR